MKKFFALIIIALSLFTSAVAQENPAVTEIDGMRYSISVRKTDGTTCFYNKKNNKVTVELSYAKTKPSTYPAHPVTIELIPDDFSNTSNLEYEVKTNNASSSEKSFGTMNYRGVFYSYTVKAIIQAGDDSKTISISMGIKLAKAPELLIPFSPRPIDDDDRVKEEEIQRGSDSKPMTLLISPYDSLQNKKDRAWFNYAGWLFNDLEYNEYSNGVKNDSALIAWTLPDFASDTTIESPVISSLVNNVFVPSKNIGEPKEKAFKALNNDDSSYHYQFKYINKDGCDLDTNLYIKVWIRKDYAPHL
ncbi:MAG: hypothetical protein ACRC3G_09165, partial [Bacteroidales bacterium]